MPWDANDPGWYKRIIDAHTRITAKYKDPRGTTLIADLVFQPFPASIAQASLERGGNAMGRNPAHGHNFVLEIHHMWLREAYDPFVTKIGQELVNEVEAGISKKFPDRAKGTIPYFMNDAAPDQKVFATYKDVEKLQAVQKNIDPKGLWQRSGGFKL